MVSPAVAIRVFMAVSSSVLGGVVLNLADGGGTLAECHVHLAFIFGWGGRVGPGTSGALSVGGVGFAGDGGRPGDWLALEAGLVLLDHGDVASLRVEGPVVRGDGRNGGRGGSDDGQNEDAIADHVVFSSRGAPVFRLPMNGN